jgi:hypothetical protein
VPANVRSLPSRHTALPASPHITRRPHFVLFVVLAVFNVHLYEWVNRLPNASLVGSEDLYAFVQGLNENINVDQLLANARSIFVELRADHTTVLKRGAGDE